MSAEAKRESRKAAVVMVTCMTVFGLCAPGPVVGASASCGQSTVVRDFLLPLAKMRPIRHVPSSGTLSFGPAGLDLSFESQLVVGAGGAAGFRFTDEAIEQRRKLHWRIEASLSRVTSAGKTRSLVATQIRDLGVVDGNKIKPFLFDLPGSPAFYRIDLEVRGLKSDRLLGAFGEYVRVMRPRSDIRVKVDSPVVAPGDMVRARLINLGTVPLMSAPYDFGFHIRRFDGSRWIYLPENPPRGPVPKVVQVLPAGREIRGCLRYRVPDDAPLGTYRFQAGKLFAEFEVTSSPPA